MIYIIGAGGMARETLNIYVDLKRGKEIRGFLEEDSKRTGAVLNGKVISDLSILNVINYREERLICAIGTPIRRRLIEKTVGLGFIYDIAIHPSVITSKWVKFGCGTIICAGNIFTSNILVDDYVIINLGCTISHDVHIGKYTTISSGVHISGGVNIGNGCFIGTGVSIIEKISIGDSSFIGAGAVVTESIPENVLATGIPARPVREISKTDWEKLI